MHGRPSLLGVPLALVIQSSISHASYASKAEAAASTLMDQWYNSTSGLWNDIFWWESANSITTLANLAAIDPNITHTTDALFANTFTQAPKTNAATNAGGTGFLNGYYDDEGWWALAWLAVYDVTLQPKYLAAAAAIFTDMTGEWGSSPCGGLWWDKNHTQVNAIANELFLSVAAHLANRQPANQSYYLDWALKQWDWFHASGLINANHTVNDGLDLTTCQNNNHTVWSYNQGVILGGLVELCKASSSSGTTKNSSFLTTASTIASAAIAALSSPSSNGALILHEPCDPTCDLTAAQFKGVFVRNLQTLHLTAANPHFESFLAANADSIWAHDRDGATDELGAIWAGPYQAANATTQSAALDALVAAAAVLVGNETQSPTGNGTGGPSTSGQEGVGLGVGLRKWTNLVAFGSLFAVAVLGWIV